MSPRNIPRVKLNEPHGLIFSLMNGYFAMLSFRRFLTRSVMIQSFDKEGGKFNAVVDVMYIVYNPTDLTLDKYAKWFGHQTREEVLECFCKNARVQKRLPLCKHYTASYRRRRDLYMYVFTKPHDIFLKKVKHIVPFLGDYLS